MGQHQITATFSLNEEVALKDAAKKGRVMVSRISAIIPVMTEKGTTIEYVLAADFGSTPPSKLSEKSYTEEELLTPKDAGKVAADYHRTLAKGLEQGEFTEVAPAKA